LRKIDDPIDKTKSKKYKTAICKYFKNGNCRYGNKCSYAHGTKQIKGFINFKE
jgi:hypothetical protein